MFKRINIVTYLLSFISMITMIVLLNILNIVPTKYLVVLSTSCAIIYLVLGLITLRVTNKVGTIVMMLIEILLGIGFVILGSYVSKTNNFITNIESPKEEALYYVIVLNESRYEKLADLENKTIGTYSLNDDNYSVALKNVQKKLSFNEQKYDDVSLIANDLLAGKEEAVLISDFNKQMLDDEIEDFKTRTRVIHVEKIAIESKIEEKDIKVNQDTFSILISGIDTHGSINKVSRSDVNIVVTINPNTNEILLTSIPRDYYVQLHNTNGLKDKLTHAGVYGIDMSVNTVSDLLNTNIDYYLRVNFDTLIKVVDEIGGIDVYSDTTFTAYNKDKFVEGINHLNGRQALSYSRERKQFKEGDRKRGEHQEQVITAIIEKVSSSKVLLSNYTGILASLENSFQTSIPTKTIKEFVKNQLDEMPKWNVTSISLDGTGSKNYTYSMPGRLLYVMIPDQTTVDYASNAIKNMQ